IEDISRLAVVKSILSPVKFVEGAPCWLKATQECSERTDNEQYLSFYFYCNEESSYDLWTADLIFALTILNTDPTKNITPMREAPRIRLRISGSSERCDIADRRKESSRQQALPCTAFARFRHDVLPSVHRKRKNRNRYGGYFARRMITFSQRKTNI
ncbi:hypothetical protein PFISCL1PPCAC_21996, partial [Pristionchus fissidentatus]